MDAIVVLSIAQIKIMNEKPKAQDSLCQTVNPTQFGVPNDEKRTSSCKVNGSKYMNSVSFSSWRHLMQFFSEKNCNAYASPDSDLAD
jgi:hypothetical protein